MIIVDNCNWLLASCAIFPHLSRLKIKIKKQKQNIIIYRYIFTTLCLEFKLKNVIFYFFGSFVRYVIYILVVIVFFIYINYSHYYYFFFWCNLNKVKVEFGHYTQTTTQPQRARSSEHTRSRLRWDCRQEMQTIIKLTIQAIWISLTSR